MKVTTNFTNLIQEKISKKTIQNLSESLNEDFFKVERAMYLFQNLIISGFINRINEKPFSKIIHQSYDGDLSEMKLFLFDFDLENHLIRISDLTNIAEQSSEKIFSFALQHLIVIFKDYILSLNIDEKKFNFQLIKLAQDYPKTLTLEYFPFLKVNIQNYLSRNRSNFQTKNVSIWNYLIPILFLISFLLIFFQKINENKKESIMREKILKLQNKIHENSQK